MRFVKFFAHTRSMEKTREKKPHNFFLRACARVRGWYAVLVKHRFTTVAGTLVFFLIMSLTPFLFWLTLLFGKTQADFLTSGLFDWAGDLLETIQASAEQATAGVSVLFLVTTLWSSTGFFYHLRRSGEIIYDYRRKKHGWKVRLSAVLLTFAILILFALAGGVLVSVNFLIEGYSPYLTYPVRYTLGLAVSFLLAGLLNWYICPYRTYPADTALGSFFTALAWIAASLAFSVYLRFSNAEKLYGALSVVIVFLLWLYWLMICFTAGVVFNRYQVEKKAHKKL